MEKHGILGIIGGGVMARAIAEGAIAKNVLLAEDIILGEPNEERAAQFASLGVTIADNRTVAEHCDYLLFAVKPQIFRAAAQDLHGLKLPTILTIMAGVTKNTVKSVLGENTKVVRAMPNLPCSVGEGMIAVDVSECTENEKSFVLGLFSATGKTVEVKESQLNAVTGVSGSGPAYVYLFLQSLIEAGKEQGLTEEQASVFAFQTVKGGLRLAEANPQRSLSELIASVSSKGGTTVAALESFRKDDFEGSVSRAVKAAVKRAEELSQ